MDDKYELNNRGPAPAGATGAVACLVDVRALVEAIVKALVDTPDKVVVTEIEGTHSCVIELSVSPGDVGKVIGKKGIHADAIRRIVHAIGGKNRKRYVLEILEER